MSEWAAHESHCYSPQTYACEPVNSQPDKQAGRDKQIYVQVVHRFTLQRVVWWACGMVSVWYDESVVLIEIQRSVSYCTAVHHCCCCRCWHRYWYCYYTILLFCSCRCMCVYLYICVSGCDHCQHCEWLSSAKNEIITIAHKGKVLLEANVQACTHTGIEICMSAHVCLHSLEERVDLGFKLVLNLTDLTRSFRWITLKCHHPQ